MNWQRLNQFPVIAIACLALAAILGWLFGWVTSVPLPVARRVAPLELPAVVPPSRRDVRPAPEVVRPGPITPMRVEPRPMEAAPPRRTEPGRADELITRDAAAHSPSSLLVEVSDSQGRGLMQPQVFLDVDAPGLGWLAVRPALMRQPDGRIWISDLPPGSYRVRAYVTNFVPADEQVHLGANETDRVVRLTLQQAERTQFELHIRLSDGSIPPWVTLRVARGTNLEPERSRFGEVEPVATTGNVPASTARYSLEQSRGVLPYTVAAGAETSFLFAASVGETQFAASLVVPASGVERRYDVVLVPSELGRDIEAAGTPMRNARVAVRLTLNGSPDVAITRINLRRALHDVAYREPTRAEGNNFVWENILSGRWYLWAEGRGFHAAFVAPVEIGSTEQYDFDIRTGHLRVNLRLQQGGDAAANWALHLWPAGHGNLGRTVQGRMAGQAATYTDFFVPEGSYTAIVESVLGANTSFIADPRQVEVKVAAGARADCEFVLRPATVLTFQCVDNTGRPVPGVEFLLTQHAAGNVPASEQSGVQKAAVDGHARAQPAPAGVVYLMIWSQSGDWNNPDKVFRLELQPGASRDLGAVIISP